MKEGIWDFHPRPQLKREKYISLNGEWKLNGHSIIVPFPPEASLSEYKGEISNDLKYEKTFTIPKEFNLDRIIIHFGAVDQIAEVRVNNKIAGKHEGGYLPFSFDITELVDKDGDNYLEVLVKDDLSKDYPYGKQSKNPKGMWYTPVSGIWQTVWLENVPDTYIERLIKKPELDREKLKIICNQKVALCRVQIMFSYKENGNLDIVQDKELPFGEGEIIITNPVNWTPENPHLYHMAISAGEDKVESYFALRTISIEEIDGVSRVCLNNKPIFLHGVLDQGYFNDGIFLPPSEEGYKKDILSMKELGFNLLRKHIKIEHEYFYYACDKLGMLVMQDMVNNGEYSFVKDTMLPTIGFKRNDRKLNKSEIRRQIFREHTKGTIEHLYNHPSIIAYTIFNEGWGQFNSDEMYDYVKELDDTRLVDSTSGWFEQTKNDFDSKHIYFRLKKLKVKKRPLFVTECGGYKYMEQGHFFGKKEYGYGTCKDKAELINKIKTMYEKMIIPYIKDGVCGCIYTQLSDVEGEINGLYTYDRKLCKVEKEPMGEIAERINEEISKIRCKSQKAVIRCSICTGEQVAGFKDIETGKFKEVMLIKDASDLDEFKRRYGVKQVEKEY